MVLFEVFNNDKFCLIPTKSSVRAAGWDLKLCEDFTLDDTTYWASTNVKLSKDWPQNCFGQIAARSSTFTKAIEVFPGIVDPDYQGEIKIGLKTIDGSTLACKQGERLAQIIPIPFHGGSDNSNTRAIEGGWRREMFALCNSPQASFCFAEWNPKLYNKEEIAHYDQKKGLYLGANKGERGMEYGTEFWLWRKPSINSQTEWEEAKQFYTTERFVNRYGYLTRKDYFWNYSGVEMRACSSLHALFAAIYERYHPGDQVFWADCGRMYISSASDPLNQVPFTLTDE